MLLIIDDYVNGNFMSIMFSDITFQFSEYIACFFSGIEWKAAKNQREKYKEGDTEGA
jgi:hypothetical protein